MKKSATECQAAGNSEFQDMQRANLGAAGGDRSDHHEKMVAICLAIYIYTSGLHETAICLDINNNNGGCRRWVVRLDEVDSEHGAAAERAAAAAAAAAACRCRRRRAAAAVNIHMRVTATQ